MAAAQARALVSGDHSKSHVLIFSKSYCPYCTTAKQVFAKHGAKTSVIELDKMSDGAAIQDKLAKATGQRTVPNVIIGNTHVGGCDDTKKLDRSGKLAELLKQ
eukprot:gene19901-30610_t